MKLSYQARLSSIKKVKYARGKQCLRLTGIAPLNNQTLSDQNNQTVVRFTTPLGATPGKTRVYLQKSRYTREIPGFDVDAALALHPGPLCQLRRDPPAQVCAPHHVLPLQVPESGRGAAPGTACGADDAAVPTFIFKIEAVLGMRFCDPSSSLQRSGAIKLAAADKAICYLTRGKCRSSVWT